MAYANCVDQEGAVWSGSTLFAFPLSSLSNNYIKSLIEAKINQIKCLKFYDI